VKLNISPRGLRSKSNPAWLGMAFGLTSLLVTGLALPGATFVWTRNAGGDASGSWTNQANWSGGTLPTSASDLAVFTNLDLTTASIITLDAGQTVNALSFGDTASGSGANWIIAPGALDATLTLAGSSPAINANNLNGTNAAIVAVPLVGTAGLTKSGGSYVLFQSASPVLGGNVAIGGNAAIGSDNALGSGRIFMGANVGTGQQWFHSVNSSHVLTNAVEIRTIRFIVGNASVGGLASAPLTLAGPVLLNQGSSGVRDIYCQEPLAINGIISCGPAGLNLASGTLTLTAANVYTNGTTFTGAGTLGFNSDAALGANGFGVAFNDNGTLRADSNLMLPVSRALTIASAKTGTVDVQGNSVTIAGPISGSGALAKTGTGVLTLAGTNSFSGGASVNGGTLLVSGKLTGAGAVTVNAGGSLGGVGAVTGPVTVAANGVLSPGAFNTASLSAGSTLLNPNSVLAVALGSSLNATNPLLRITGNLTLDGVLRITDLGGFTNGAYALMTYSGSLNNNFPLPVIVPGGLAASFDTSVTGKVSLIVGQQPAVVPSHPASFTTALDAYDLSGWNNAFTIGGLAWSNAAAAASGSVPVGAPWWNITALPLALGANRVSLTGTNSLGASATAVLNITRMAGGAVPFTITNTPSVVSTTSTNIGGTVNTNLAWSLWFEVRSNSLAGPLLDYGALITRPTWQFTARHFVFGTNVISIFCTNGLGESVRTSLSVIFSETVNPYVRPRPRPAEIYWGGLSTNNPALVGAGAQWEFVKRYQDGFFFHTAYSADFADTDKAALANILYPYNPRYCEELGGGCTAALTWPAWQAITTWGANIARYQSLGLIMSDITHDYHMENMEDLCRANPSWLPQDEVAFFTGDLFSASPAYPYASGQWADAFTIYHTNNPHLKVGITSSPVWWPWDSSPGLAGNNLRYEPLTDANGAPVLVNAEPVSFSFNAHDIVASHLNACARIGYPYFFFQSDCPYDYFGAWSSPADAAQNRAKIRTYEAYLHSRAGRHTLICNVSNASSQPGGDDAQDLYYKTNSLNSMMLHQREGGRADRYLFESWYQGIPHAAQPETKLGSYANLALDGIKYLKGIADTNGTLEQLHLTLVSTGAYTVVQIQNLGDVPCLPAIQAFESGDPNLLTRYFDANGADVTTLALGMEGFTLANQLQPGQAANFGIATTIGGSGVVSNKTVTLEAFWNPQDPTGVVRDRLTLTTGGPGLRVKANNTQNLTNGLSWVGGTAPDTNSLAIWDATVTAANTTILGGNTGWAGVQILNPGGAVTVNSGNALTLGVIGVDLSRASQNLTLGCALSLVAPQTWSITNSRTLTVNGSLSGTSAIALTQDGAGTLKLGAANNLPGAVNLSAGTLDLNSFNQTFGSLAANDGTSVKLGGATLTVGGNNVSTVVAAAISGTGNLNQTGTGTLTLTGSNSFSGWTAIAGTLQLGTGGTNGTLASSVITNNGTLVLNHADALAYDVRGSGTITKLGGGTFTLAGAMTRSFTSLFVREGLFQHTNGTTTFTASGDGASEIEGGATLSLTGGTLNTSFYTRLGATGAGTVNVTGGVLNNSGEILFAYSGDGGMGTLNVSGTGTVGAHFLRLGNNGRALVNLDGGTVTADRIFSNSGQGELYLNGGTLRAGSGSGTPWIQADLSVLGVKSGGAVIDSNGRNVVIAEALVAMPGSSGGLNKIGAGTLTVSNANTFTGSTVVSAGTLALVGAASLATSSSVTVNSGATLDATGLSPATLVVPANQVLTGRGTVLGPVAVAGTLAPGASLGTLTFNSNLTLGGTSIFEISKNGTTPTNDTVAGIATLSYGGALVVTNIGTNLVVGDSFRLFVATNYSGTFTSLVLPALPLGLAWTNRLLQNGTLAVFQAVATNPPNLHFTLSASNLMLSWPADHTGWRLESQTNFLGIGRSTNWLTVTNAFATNQVVMPVDPSNGCVFYRLAYP
jgi:autotransporter-associated beta strand protein